MKKIILNFIACMVMMNLISCQLDNYDTPDAQVFGSIRDKETGELVQQEIGTSGDACNIQVLEHGFNIKVPQKWKIKLDGSYRNNLVFSGTYDIVLINGNFIPLDTIKAYNFHEGKNELNFDVIPNIRIKDSQISKNENGIIAKFKLEYAHSQGKIKTISLYGQKDQNPCNTFNLVKVEQDVSNDNYGFENKNEYSSKEFTLNIPFDSDEGKKLTSGRSYFFRIGAKPTNLGEGIQEKYNYSPVVEIKL